MNLSLTTLAEKLGPALTKDLPGEAAHRRLSPVAVEGAPLPPRRGVGRPAAGLLLVYPAAQGPSVLLTLRSRSLPHHRGQVSLPGGMVEEGETLRQAAVREASEEAAVPPEAVRVLGSLSTLFIPVTGFSLTPFVGVATTRPAFQANPAEVDRLLEMPLAYLVHTPPQWEIRQILGRECRVPYFPFAGEKIWGATGMILAEFLSVLNGVAGLKPPEEA